MSKKFLQTSSILALISLSFSSFSVKAMEVDTPETGHHTKSKIKEGPVKKDPVNNILDRLELFGALQTVVDETCKNVEKLDKLDDPRVMILGTTGAGKSTLIHQLVGRKVFADYPQNEKSLKLVVNPEDQIGEAFEIGHGPISCTTHPNAYHDKENKVVWWDCPGFLDNKGIIQEFSNQLAVSKLFTERRPSKILLVAEEAKFRVTRSGPVWDAVEAIVTMFKDPNGKDDEQITKYLKDSLVLVVTQAPDNFDIGYELKKLNSAPPASATDITVKLMDYLGSNVKTKCFTSFNPSEKGLFKLEARENILDALKKTPGSNLVARQASVKPEYKGCAVAVTKNIKKQIGSSLSTYINSIASNITINTPLNEALVLEKFFIDTHSKKDEDDSTFLESLQSSSQLKGEVQVPELNEVIRNVKKIAEVHPFLEKFGAQKLNIGQIWKTSSLMTLALVEKQKEFSEVINKQKEESEIIAEKHNKALKEQKEINSKQLEEAEELKTRLKSGNEEERKITEKKLEELNLKIEASEKQFKQKEEQYESERTEREKKAKIKREQAENNVNKIAKEQKELHEKKIEDKAKKVKEVEKKLSILTETFVAESDRGAFKHIGKGLDILLKDSGKALGNFVGQNNLGIGSGAILSFGKRIVSGLFKSKN